MKNRQKSIWNYVKEYKFNGLNYQNFNKEVNNHMMDMNQELLQKSAIVVGNIITELLSTLDTVSHKALIRLFL